ncbi:hypothetical protein JYT92_00685 [bacterium AH-315-L15]|nr:hypothetical protein [bacterium AH-315-L15]
MDDKGESVLSKFSNQDPGSGDYGEREDEEIATFTKPRTSAAAKAKKKKKNKAAKKARKKNRK